MNVELPRTSGEIDVDGQLDEEEWRDAVQVEVLLPPGATPHDFEPSPAQAEILAQADLLLVVGFLRCRVCTESLYTYPIL